MLRPIIVSEIRAMFFFHGQNCQNIFLTREEHLNCMFILKFGQENEPFLRPKKCFWVVLFAQFGPPRHCL